MNLNIRFKQCAGASLRLFALACLVAPAFAAPMQIDTVPDEIASAALGGRPGQVAVGVWHHGEEHLGAAQNGEHPAADPIFEIGSITKVFTGLLLAQDVEQGRLALDDTLGQLVTEHLPAPVAAITLRQLVTHTSCLPRMPANFDLDPNKLYRDYHADQLWSSLAALDLKHAPPCAPSYSNYGMAVLGMVMAWRAGQPWEHLVRDRITAPLGMHDTMQTLGSRAHRLAPGFNGAAPAPAWEFDAMAGAGALRSTAHDMLIFGRALLAGRSGPLGPAAERLLQPLHEMDGGEIGYAIMMRGPAAHRVYYHDGATGAYRASLAFMPDTQDVLVVLGSNAQSAPDGAIVDILSSRFPLALSPMPLDPSRLPEYAGVFRYNEQLALSFLVQDGQLNGHLTGQAFSALTPSGPDTFALAQAQAEFRFERSEGTLRAVSLRQRGAEMRFSRVDEALPPYARDPGVTPAAFGGHYVAHPPGMPAMDFEVVASDGQLRGRLNTQPFVQVFAMAGRPDRYVSDLVDAQFQFERDATGRATALVMFQNGGQVRAERVAEAALDLSGTPIYVRGNMNAWGVGAPLQADGDGLYRAHLSLAKGRYEFKLASADWEAVDLGANDTQPLSPGASTPLVRKGANLTLAVAADARYVLTLDARQPADLRITISMED